MILEIAIAAILLCTNIILINTFNGIYKEIRRIRKQQDCFFEHYFETEAHKYGRP